MSEKWIWDRYWQCDRIASCFDGAGVSNYDDSVAAGWRTFFERLPDGTHVLDLCSGNGAIALLAAETSRRQAKGFRIIAVDQAGIDPAAYVTRHQEELAAIEFRPGTAAEALPFADARFGAVVSQYGLEYTDIAKSLAELVRVTAPGGRVRLVMHAAQGVVSADAARVVEDADFLLDAIDLPGAAQRCFEAVTQAERSAESTERRHQLARENLAAFETALAETARRLPAAADKAMLRNAGAVLLDTFKRRAHFDVDQLVSKASELRTEILAHRGRLRALIAAAVTRADLSGIADRLREAGANPVDRTDVLNQGALIAHVLEARFPS